jgi:tetratricopeptide (TPR) repeat protein
VRDILLQKKDFKNLEHYLLASLKDFEKKKFFNKSTHIHKILVLSWIINTLSKNKKFAESLDYTERLHKALQEHNRLYYDKYIWTYYQSLVVNYSFSGRNRKAIELLEGLKGDPKYSGIPFYNMFLYLNLAALYFCEGELSSAVLSLSKIIIKDVFNKLSKELQFHISVVEAILHYEQGDYDYVSHKLEEIVRSYKTLLKSEEYKREKDFLNILKGLVKGSRIGLNPKLLSKAEEFIRNSPEFEPGSNETINYTLWLESKLKNKKYYERVMESVKRKEM